MSSTGRAPSISPGSARPSCEHHGARLEARRLGGWVRRCHGDLHLGNVVWLDGRPVLFDAIEFNDAIACVDVWYDLAFLLMDLLHRGLDAHAHAVFQRYVEGERELDGLRLLPLFLACRAAIRAKTTAEAVRQHPDDEARRRTSAREYLDLAITLSAPPRPALLAVGGWSGSGKSTVAARGGADARQRSRGRDHQQRCHPQATRGRPGGAQAAGQRIHLRGQAASLRRDARTGGCGAGDRAGGHRGCGPRQSRGP